MSRRIQLVPLALAALLCLPWGGGCSTSSSDREKAARIEAMYERYRGSFPDEPEITVAELLRTKAEQAAVLSDVREAEERAVSIIPGAMTPAQFEAQIARHSGQTLVSYCTIGYRSGQHAEGLRRRGLRAFNLKGGILVWTHAGQPVVHDGKPVRRLHVYGRRWNLAPAGYRSEW